MLNGAVEMLERRRTAPIGDRGMIVSIVSWILLVVMICILIARLAMKFAMSRKGHRFGLDDAFIVLAAVFSIGQTAAVSMESMHALGQHITTLNVGQMRIMEKAEYAGCMLYLANMGCARISVCLLIRKILPGNVPQCTALVFAIFSALWTISGVLVTAFPCSLPQPWAMDAPGKKCYNLIKFINYVGVTNIVVEVLLVTIPLFVWNIRLTAGRRVSVSCVFLARLSIVAAVAAQLTFFNRYSTNPDFTFHYWRTVLCIQIAQNLSVITACLPGLHPFIMSLLSGATKSDSLRFDCSASKGIKQYFRRGDSKFDPTASQSSSLPMKEAKEYCHPLATYGLDRSSAHLNSQHFNRFPANVATPIRGPNPPENVFNRSIEIPRTRQPSCSSTSQKDLPPIPKTLSQVGVLPLIEWESESSDIESGRSSAGSRRPNSEYVFNREKVISVPEANAMYDQEYWRKYPPPPSGEK